MDTPQRSWPVDRRTLLKTSAAIAAVQFSSPFIIKARGEAPVRIGMVDPLTGVYAAIAQGEVVGAVNIETQPCSELTRQNAPASGVPTGLPS